MFNKKAMGLHWYVLFISLFISIGILYYSIASVDIPKVGQYSLSIIKTLEKNSRIPITIEGSMELIDKQTLEDFKKNKIFGLMSDCRGGYTPEGTQTLRGTDDDSGFDELFKEESECIIDEDDLIKYFEIISKARYHDFMLDYSDYSLDASNAKTNSSIEKEEDEYFNIINVTNGIKVHINIEKDIYTQKEIGNIIMKPAYKFPVDYAFDDEKEEICILSVDCGADCDDVMNAGYDFKVREKSCSYYHDCVVAKDDFGKLYLCDKEHFCMGNCCDDHEYDLDCGRKTGCGRPIGAKCDEGCTSRKCSKKCGTDCDVGCSKAKACGKCGNDPCPEPEEPTTPDTEIPDDDWDYWDE